MSNMLRTISSLGVAALVGLTPVASHAATAQSLGTYQTTDRKMDFALALCGNSGKELCVTLAAARWGRWQVWLLGAPIVFAALWGTTAVAVQLLPNLM